MGLEEKSAPKRRRRIFDPLITRLSIVGAGANGASLVYKDQQGVIEFSPVVKSTERGEILMLAAIPNRDDAHAEFIEPEDVVKAAHSWARHGMKLDIDHAALFGGAPLTSEEAYAVESFIVAKGDERFANWKDNKGNDLGDLTGTWAVLVKAESAELREAVKSGKLAGASMFGVALRQVVKSQGKPMDANEMKLLTDGIVKGMEGVIKALVPAPVTPAAPVAPKEEPKPVVKSVEVPADFDPTNPDHIQEQKDRIAMSQCDFSTLEGLVKWEQYRAAKTATPAKGGSNQSKREPVVKSADELTPKQLAERGRAAMDAISGTAPKGK